MRQNVIRDTKNLNVCTCIQIPVASVALDLSSPFAISSRVAKTESNVLQLSTYKTNVYPKAFAIVSVAYQAVIQIASIGKQHG